jgi:uncharacterized membrane protein YeaQ/YmgE (transglycosylase-associated protein family)
MKFHHQSIAGICGALLGHMAIKKWQFPQQTTNEKKATISFYYCY